MDVLCGTFDDFGNDDTFPAANLKACLTHTEVASPQISAACSIIRFSLAFTLIKIWLSRFIAL